jgi:hypothetical protein
MLSSGVGVEGVEGALETTDDKVDKSVAAAEYSILGWHHSYPHVAIAAACVMARQKARGDESYPLFVMLYSGS